jgi:antitoxin (DNA-binding transcriptional repressor) of toxin-antitoxin stability system
MADVTATEAARNLSDLLNRVRYRGESFDVVRGGEVVARIVPATSKRATVRDLFALLRDFGPVDDTFADDLEAVQNMKLPMPEDPWGT